MMLKRLCVWVLMTAMLLSNFITVEAAGREIDIHMVRSLASDNSSGLQNATIEKIKKEIELQQAKDGINDIKRAENTVRFSLLFKIKFPEKHGLPKEIELIMKIPEIASEILVLDEKKKNEERKSEISAELAFYDVLMGEYKLNFYEDRLKDSKETLKAVENQYKSGDGKKEDVEYLENKVQTHEKELQSAILDLASKKKKLGDKLNIDATLGYRFKEYLPQVNIKREELPKILEYALKHDFELFEATQSRKLAEREVNELLSIYNALYSKYIGNVKSYIANNRNKKMDYEKFIQIYNHALTQIDSPWAGHYKISLLFFSIKIPKEWFKGTYSGTRYMEDQKYALFVALVEQDKKRMEEQEVKKALEEKIYNTYESLKIMERAYEESLYNLEQAEKRYDRAYNENKLGLTDFTTLETIRSSLYDQQKSMYEMRIDYAKEISSFDLYTSGYIRKKAKASTTEESDYAAGQSIGEYAEWYLNAYVTDYNFIFGLRIPDKYDVTHYELHHGNLLVGKRMPIDETINHLPLTYEDNSLLVVTLYKDNALKYTAYFDGGDYEGVLNLMETSGPEPGEVLAGICSVSYINELMSRFSITLNPDYDYDRYSVLYEGSEIISEEKDVSIETLNMYFSNIELVTLNIYKNDGLVKSFELREEEVKEDITVGKIIDSL